MLRTFPNTLRPRWIERRRWGLSIPDLISMYNAILDHHWRQGLNIAHMSECLDNTSKLFWMFPSWHYSCCYNCFQTSTRACCTLRRKRPWALASDTQLADRYSGSRLNWLMSDAMYSENFLNLYQCSSGEDIIMSYQMLRSALHHFLTVFHNCRLVVNYFTILY